MSSLRQDEPARIEPADVVAMQPANGHASATAHAIAPELVKLGDHGLTRCGFPVEYLTVVPHLTWGQVRAEDRCEHCAAEVGRSAQDNRKPQVMAEAPGFEPGMGDKPKPH